MNYPLFFTAFSLLLVDWIFLFLLPQKKRPLAVIERFLRISAYLTLLFWMFSHTTHYTNLLGFTISISMWVFSLVLSLFSKEPIYQFLSKIIQILSYFSFGFGLLQHHFPSPNLPLLIILVLITITTAQIILVIHRRRPLPFSTSLYIVIDGICVSLFLLTTLATGTQGVAWRDRTALFIGVGGTFTYLAEVIYIWQYQIKKHEKILVIYEIFSSLAVFCLSLGIVTKTILVIL